MNVSHKLKVSVNPNPVKNASIIKVESTCETNCTIRIFDFEGRIVTQLYDGGLSYGSNYFGWKVCSDAGKRLPCGTYLCVASSMGISNFCKIIIE